MDEFMYSLRDMIPLAMSYSSEVFIAGLIVISALSAILFFSLSQLSLAHPGSFKIRFTTLIFSIWVVSTVLWSGFFYTIPIPGAFDLTVERLIFIFLVLSLLYVVFNHRVNFKMTHSVEFTLAIFLLLCLISMTIHGFTPVIEIFAKPWFIFLVGYLLPTIAFIITKYFLDPERDYPVVFLALFLLGLHVAIVAILENYSLNSFVFPKFIVDPTITLHLERARGPFLNAAFNGQLLCIAFLAGLALLPLVRHPYTLFLHLSFLLYLPAIWFTRTRSVYLQFLVIVIGLVVGYKAFSQKWKFYGIFGIVVLSMVFANLDKLASEQRQQGGLAQMEEVDIRFELVNQSIGLIAEHPAFGVGLGQFRTVSLFAPTQQEYQHNHLIGLAAELGLVGLAVYLTFLGLIFRRLLALVDNPPNSDIINLNTLLLISLAVIASLLNNTFVEPSLHNFPNLILFIFAAMVDRLYNRDVLKIT